MNWSAKQYSAFENERTRPVRDLVAALPNERVARAVDLGCGPQLHRGAGRALSGRRDQRHGQFAGHDRRGAQAPARPVLRAVGHRRLESAGRLRRDPGERLPAMGAGARGTLSAPGGQAGAGRQPGGPDPDNMEEPAHRLAREVAADGPWAARIGAVKHPPRHSAAWYYELLAGLRPAGRVAHHLSPSPARRRWCNGSPARRSGPTWVRWTRRSNRPSWPSTSRASNAPIRPCRTAPCCCRSRACSSSPGRSSGRAWCPAPCGTW